jgi:hypothetical protein
MKGIEKSERFFNETVKPELIREFPSDWASICVAKLGKGSECYFCDDEISEDHDFTRGFQFILTDEQDHKFGFALTRFYSRFDTGATKHSAYKERREGVFSREELYSSLTGLSHVPVTVFEWFSIPEYALYEITNGKIFQNGNGKVAGDLETFKTGMPEDVLRKRLAAHLILASQALEYNWPRILSHGEGAAARYALFQAAEHLSHIHFELNGKPTPYYKWRFRLERQLPLLPELSVNVEALLEGKGPELFPLQSAINETLYAQGWIQKKCDSLESAAFQVAAGIENMQLKKLHIMEY